jgi:hypothetical protein
MLEISVARINSFALEPTDYGLAGKIGPKLHPIAERVMIFKEIFFNSRLEIQLLLQKEVPKFQTAIEKIICHYMKQ